MLYLIGLGLGDESDITRRGLEVVKGCKRILLESYTSILPGISKERLEELCWSEAQRWWCWARRLGARWWSW